MQLKRTVYDGNTLQQDYLLRFLIYLERIFRINNVFYDFFFSACVLADKVHPN